MRVDCLYLAAGKVAKFDWQRLLGGGGRVRLISEVCVDFISTCSLRVNNQIGVFETDREWPRKNINYQK